MTKLKSILSAALLIMAATSLSSTAQAGCGPSGDGSSIGMAFKNLAMQVANQEAAFHGNPHNRVIVGLWKFVFTIGNDVIDAGYQTWHADGTELMNSGRPPITGSFCMGVWEQAGVGHYKLNHFAMGWMPSGFTRDGTDNIHLDVQLGPSGDTFTGTFAIDHYDNDGNPMAHVEGNVSATRITVE